MLLGGVEVHLANAAAHLRLAHDLLAGRGAYKGGK